MQLQLKIEIRTAFSFAMSSHSFIKNKGIHVDNITWILRYYFNQLISILYMRSRDMTTHAKVLCEKLKSLNNFLFHDLQNDL